MGKIKRGISESQMGHSKIIGWEKGLPVSSLFFPAENSDVSSYAITRFYNFLRFHRSWPFMCNLAITKKCNFNCKHCSAAGQDGKELSTEEWKDIIRQCIELGVIVIIFTGGEPLQRKDICEIIKFVDKKKVIPLIFTNGFFLKDKIKELKKSGLNRIFISIDYADSNLHDNHRQMKGAYKKAIKAVKIAKKEGMLVGISTFGSLSRMKDGTLEKIFRLGNLLKVNEIMIFNEMPVGRNTINYKLGSMENSYYDEFKEFIKINQQRYKKMGIYAYKTISSIGAANCSAGTNMFKVAFNGDLCPCEFCKIPIGNLKKNSLFELWPKLRKLAITKQNETYGCWVLEDYKKKFNKNKLNDRN